MSIQKLGGGRTRDLGPSVAIHSRGRVPGGVMVSQGIAPGYKGLAGLTTLKGSGGSIVRALKDTPEEAARRKANALAAKAYRDRR